MESLIHCMHQYTIQLQHTNQYTTIQLQYTMNLHQYIIQLQYTRSQNHQYTRNQSIIHLQLLYTKSQSIIHLQLQYIRSLSIIQLQLQYTRSQNQFIIHPLQLQLTRHHQLQFTILLQHLWLQQVSVSTDDIKKLKYNCPFNGIGVTSTVECTHGDRNVCFWATLNGRCLADSKIDIFVCRYNIQSTVDITPMTIMGIFQKYTTIPYSSTPLSTTSCTRITSLSARFCTLYSSSTINLQRQCIL